MSNNNYENALVITTLTDEAAANSLYDMDQDTIIAFIEFVGGEEAFYDTYEDACYNGINDNVPALNDPQKVRELYLAHKDEIIKFCTASIKNAKNGNYTMIEYVTERVNNEGNNYNYDDIAKGIYSGEEDESSVSDSVKRSVVKDTLLDLFGTYSDMRMGEE